MPEPVRLIDWVPPPEKPNHVKILCFGLSRTGSMSLLHSLRHLGYNPYHMTVASQRLSHLAMWNEALATKYGPSPYCNSYTQNAKLYSPDDIAKLVRDFDVAMDIPTLMYMPELLHAFPDTKIILTHHPKGIASWLPSIRLIPQVAAWRIWDRLLLPLGDEFCTHYFPVLRRCLEIWAGQPWPKPHIGFDEKHMEKLYTEHAENVRRLAKEQGRDLLEFGPQMGWGPLCAFLGKEVLRDRPYPSINNGDNLLKIRDWAMRRRLRKTVLPILLKSVGAAVAVGLAW